MIGWECHHEDCGTGDRRAPRRWPFPCPECGRPTDPAFDEPWAHEALGYQLRGEVRSGDAYRRHATQDRLHIWAYKDAHRRGDLRAAEAAWTAQRQTVVANLATDSVHSPSWVTTAEMARLAAEFGDLDGAARELAFWYPHIDARDLDDDSGRDFDARMFLSACIAVLECPATPGRAWERDLDRMMADIRDRVGNNLTPMLDAGFWRIGEMRAFHLARIAIVEEARSATAIRAWLPSVEPGHSWSERADAALTALETQDDTGPLDEVLERADVCALPSLRLLLLARRHLAMSELDTAERALNEAGRATDRLAAVLRPRIRATLAWLHLLRDQDQVDAAIACCRAGGRRRTAADTSLAKLLLWRARRPNTPDDRAVADVREAVRLARRGHRFRRRPGTAERLVLLEARSALDTLRGKQNVRRLRRTWRESVAGAGSVVDRTRLATGWVGWAVGTGDPQLAAEAYSELAALVPADVASRYGESARQRVLSAAQRHTEDAGYWLARTRRYREAAIALETGRAIGLSEGAEGAQDAVAYGDITAATADGSVVYLAAANAGGYALIVAATHDPQFVELAKLDRASGAPLVAATTSAAATRAPVRELAPAGSAPGLLSTGLRTVWDDGLRDLLLLHARGRVLTFIPVGLLSLLPLHAAGGPPRARLTDQVPSWQHTGDFSAIRYAPNARSLARCRTVVSDLAATPLRLIAVDVPDGHGIGPSGYLRHVARETTEIMRRWSRNDRVIHDCTWAEFRATADEFSVWHLACHGSANSESIMDSRLCFADRRVTLSELRDAFRPAPRRLAVLSACETNVIGADLPNESIGLPTALLRLGFAGVIASAWKVDDLATAYLMTAFYHYWCTAGLEPAVAMNKAQEWLRKATSTDLTALLPDTAPPVGDHPPYADPHYWAAFAFTGA